MSKFKTGDIVVLNSKPTPPFRMSAPIGTIAIVKDDEDTDGLIRVRWIRDARGQMDGGYRASNFRYANKEEVAWTAQQLYAEASRVQSWQAPPPPKPPIKAGDTVRNLNGSRGEVLFVYQSGDTQKALIRWASEIENTWRTEHLTKEDCNCD